MGILMSAFAWAGHQDHVPGATTRCESCISFNKFVLAQLTHALNMYPLLTQRNIYGSVLLTVLYPMTENFVDFQDVSLNTQVTAMFDQALSMKMVTGNDLATQDVKLGIMNYMIQTANISATLHNVSSPLSTVQFALKMRGLVRGIGFHLLRHSIVNNPPQLMVVNDHNGARIIELSVFRSTTEAMHGSSATMGSNTKVIFPSGGLFPDYDASTQTHYIRQFIVSYFERWIVSPWAYDGYRPLKSGITSLYFSDVDEKIIEFPSFPPGAEVILAPKLSFPSGSPKCFYRKNTQTTALRGWGDDGIASLGLKDEFAVAAAATYVQCKLQHLRLSEDVAIGDGCFTHQRFSLAESCSSHGFCKQTGVCQCMCGYYLRNCSQVHVAALATPTKSRFFSGAPLELPVKYNSNGVRIAFVVQKQPVNGIDQWSCDGAGATKLNSMSMHSQAKLARFGIDVQRAGPQFGGLKVEVIDDKIVLPKYPNLPLSPGRYTVCYCNAEKRNDPTYSNCNMDCAYQHRQDTVIVIDEPRLGPIGDPGNARVMIGSRPTYRLQAGITDDTGIEEGDMLYAAPDCSQGPASVDGVNRTRIMKLGNREATYQSAFFTLPSTLYSDGFAYLKLCFATKEMGISPIIKDFFELSHTMTVVSKPTLGGANIRVLSGSSPDFHIKGGPGTGHWGISGGDWIYFNLNCGGAEKIPLQIATVKLRTVRYGDPKDGSFDCNLENARADPTVLSASSVRGKLQNEHAKASWCGEVRNGRLNSDTAWCSAIQYDMLRAFTNPSDAEWYGSNKHGEWLQLDIGSSVVLVGVQTQGRHDADEWVKQYAIATSTDGHTWVDYTQNGVLHLFNANWDRDSIVSNELTTHTNGQFIRIYPKKWQRAMSMRAGLLACFSGTKVILPNNPALISDGVNVRQLKTCFATRRSEGDSPGDFVELDEKLNIIPEPTDPLGKVMVPRGSITSIAWVNAGESMPGVEGDFVAFHRTDCSLVRGVDIEMPNGPSGIITLGPNAQVSRDDIMRARLNEMNSGEYKICYATKESLGDANIDFRSLGSVLRVFISSREPRLHVAPAVTMGQDIVVGWEANNKLDGRVSHSADWIGLYKKGECQQLDLYDDKPKSSVDRHLLVKTSETKLSLTQNQCFIASESLKEGHVRGEVRFTPEQYGNKVGDYEVRYFVGDSVSGNGYFCRGLQETGDATYRQCTLEAKVSSSTVSVRAAFADGSYQHMSAQDAVPQASEQKLPGLETFCVGPECSDV